MRKRNIIICSVALVAVVAAGTFAVCNKSKNDTNDQQVMDQTMTDEDNLPDSNGEDEVNSSVDAIEEDGTETPSDGSMKEPSEEASGQESPSNSEGNTGTAGNSSNETGTSEEAPSTSDSDDESGAEDEFLNTTEGQAINETCLEFAKAYLAADVTKMKEYLTSDAYVDQLDEAESEVSFETLVVYDYDETKQTAVVSLPMTLGGEDSLTYLSMSLIKDGDDYKVADYGLEK